MIEPQEAGPRLSRIYEKTGGDLPHILKVQSLHPRSLEAHLNYYRSIMFASSPLSRTTREMIATLVSVWNECHY